MFRIESTPNPLDALVAGTGTAYVQNQLAKNAEKQEMDKTEKALAMLTPESTDIDWIKAMANVPERLQPQVAKIHENVSKGRREAEERKANAPTEADARLAGISPEEYAKLSPEGRKAAQKQASTRRNKYEARTPAESEAYQSVVGRPDFLTMSEAQFEKAADESGLNESDRKEVRQSRQKGREQDLESRKLLREFHNDSAKFDEKLRDSADIAKKQQNVITSIRSRVLKGELNPASFGNFFQGTKIGDFFKTAAQGELEASIPILIEGMREIFGVRLTDADLAIIKNKLPDIGKSPEANLAILDVLQNRANEAIEKYDIGTEIKKKNLKLRPLGYEDEIFEEFNKRHTMNEDAINDLPSPADHTGKTIRDTVTGQLLTSDGTSWRPKNG